MRGFMDPCLKNLPLLWYRCIHRICTGLYFDRVTVTAPGPRRSDGPVMYVALHRNGAVDGFVYHRIAPRGVFMVSKQLRRSFFGRMFFGGIAVTRRKDGEDDNSAAMRQCLDLLAGGGELVIFPEGTSSLEPRHLPFKMGAAKIALDALDAGVPLTIIPLGIHYECAWSFRSRVEVVIGEPVLTEMAADANGRGRLRELKRRMDRALEEVGVNFESAERQSTCERLAYASTLGTDRSYFQSLKKLESADHAELEMRWKRLPGNLLLHHGVPLFPMAPRLGYLLMLLVIGPGVALGWILNAPPLLSGWLAGRRLADGKNVISLWRIMAGVPVALIWSAMMIGASAWSGGGWGVAIYLGATAMGAKFYPRTRKLAVAVWNGFFHRPAADGALKLRGELLTILES